MGLKNGSLYGVEALARWRHPTLGDISPARFVPLAEECGLIGDLGDWAVREACSQLSIWRNNGLRVPSVSVNLSATNFHNLNLPRMIAATLAEFGLAASDLMLEITEGVVLDATAGTLRTIAELHRLGVRLSMDDFGTGYSSLGHLRRLIVDELKLDRSFVQGLENDDAARALTSAVIRIGESLSLPVVAEGIENEEQRRFLIEQGCAAGQGFLFSPPLPANDLEDCLRAGGGVGGGAVAGWVLKARVAGSGGDGGATIAVRSVRSGLPRRQPRPPSAPYGFPRAHLHAPPSPTDPATRSR